MRLTDWAAEPGGEDKKRIEQSQENEEFKELLVYLIET